MASVIPSAPLGTDTAEDRFGLRAARGQRPGAAAERRFRFELAAHPGSVAQARRLTRSRLSGWSVCEDTCDTAALVVSELVTNAIVHAAGQRVVCELHDAEDLVRIAVCDEGCAPGDPRPSSGQPDEEHGRGLLLVAAVSRAWGAQDTGPGLLVWAELARSAGRADNRTADDDHETEPGTAADFGLDDLDRLEAAFEAGSVPAQPGTPAARAEHGRPDHIRPQAQPDHVQPRAQPHAQRDHAASDHPRPEHTRPEHGRPDGDTRPRADLGWSAKKPPNDGRGTGAEEAEGSWRTGTVGVPRDPSAHDRIRDQERDRRRL